MQDVSVLVAFWLLFGFGFWLKSVFCPVVLSPLLWRPLITLSSTFFGTSSRMPTHHQNVNTSPQMGISRVTKKSLSRNAEFEVGNTDNSLLDILQQVCSAISVRAY